MDVDSCADEFAKDVLLRVIRKMFEDWHLAKEIQETICDECGGVYWIFETFRDKVMDRSFKGYEVEAPKYNPLPNLLDFQPRTLYDLMEIAVKEAAKEIKPIIQTNFFLISQKMKEHQKREEEVKAKQEQRKKKLAEKAKEYQRLSELPSD
jgi:hypothetical protein